MRNCTKRNSRSEGDYSPLFLYLSETPQRGHFFFKAAVRKPFEKYYLINLAVSFELGTTLLLPSLSVVFLRSRDAQLHGRSRRASVLTLVGLVVFLLRIV